MEFFRKINIKYKFHRLLKQPISASRIELIENTLQFFPCTIHFSDGSLMSDHGFFSNSLSNAWYHAEEQNLAKDEHIDFMIWSIYCVLHKRCRHLFLLGIYSLNISESDYNEINKAYIHSCLTADLPLDIASEQP